MGQSTWAEEAGAWSGTSYVWANITYADSVALASNVTQTDSGLANYPSTATLSANTTFSGAGGFSLVGEALFSLSAGQTSAANAIYISSVTLAVSDGLTSIGNKLYVDSITMGTTVNIPLPGTTTWDLDASTWSGTSGSWGYTPTKSIPITATMTQTIFSELNEEDTVFPRSLGFSSDYGMAGTMALVVPVVGTLSNEQSIKNNVNYEESGTMSMAGSASSDNSFLWNDVVEDTGTTWTKISDPDE